MENPQKTIHIQYYAILREQSGCTEETVLTDASTPQDLYQELQSKHGFTVPIDFLRVAINNEFRQWDVELRAGDNLVFIPPVAGG